MKISPSDRLEGTVSVPGDKSISHRFAILASMASGKSSISNYSSSSDCQSTLNCLGKLGVPIHRTEDRIVIEGSGIEGFRRPTARLDAGNSGTTIRLLSGVLAGLPFDTVIAGDESLNRRPMRRIIDPLARMGAAIQAREREFPPLEIRGSRLQPIEYVLPVASAQVKSCVLLAGLTASGRTTVVEKVPTRDHTERALPAFGVEPEIDGGRITVTGKAELNSAELVVPGDLSSALFLVVAAILVPGAKLQVNGVGVNPTRAALLELLESSGAAIRRENLRNVGREPVCDIHVSYSPDFASRFPTAIGGSVIPNLIDEIPILGVLATQLPGGLVVRDAEELRKKESDRIRAIVGNLVSCGVPAEEAPDGFHVPFAPAIQGGAVRTFGDHRIAMAFAVLGLISSGGVEIDDPACADVSFPGFFATLSRLTC